MTVRWNIIDYSRLYDEVTTGFHPAWDNFCRSMSNGRAIMKNDIDLHLRQYNAQFSNDDAWAIEFKTDKDLSFFLLRWS